MIHKSFHIKNCSAQLSSFSHNSGKEFAITLNSSNNLTFEEQLQDIYNALNNILVIEEIPKENLRFSRLYVSDIINQKPIFFESSLFSFLKDDSCISIIQQAPLCNSKVSLFIRLSQAEILEKTILNNVLFIKEKQHEYLWTSNFDLPPNQNSYVQSYSLVEELDKVLVSHGASLANNCVRTWFYVTNIDKNYMAMVEARKKYFTEVNLVPSTHFIASTGIEGKSCNPHRTIAMESFSVLSLGNAKMSYINVPDFMNSTHEYGVTFERATQLEYDDYRHILVSGTASINNKGDILFTNDISSQFERAIINIEALLKAVDTTLADILYYIIYLRDFNEKDIVSNLFADRCPNKPAIFVLAPVCRPGWLIEIECEVFGKINSR